METRVYDVPEALSDAIQARQIKMEGLKEMIAFCLAKTDYEVPADKVKVLQDDYFEFKTEYEELKKEVQDIIDAELEKENRKPANWNLDFASRKVTVELVA